MLIRYQIHSVTLSVTYTDSQTVPIVSQSVALQMKIPFMAPFKKDGHFN